jgi:hypothetical protein
MWAVPAKTANSRFYARPSRGASAQSSKELKEELQRWHEPVAELGKRLRSVVQDEVNYHAVPGIVPVLTTFGRR